MRGKLINASHKIETPRITPAGAGKTGQSLSRHRLARDHPRRCGENKTIRLSRHKKRGSPPQVRGKPQPMKGMSRDDRITPAGAGKTNHIIQTATIAADHPRRCGENGAHARRWCCEMGSPPQVRGKLNHAALTDSNAWDHPRRCGENVRSLKRALANKNWTRRG